MATRAKTPAKTGRPSEYREEYAAEAEQLYRTGLTDEQVAEYFKIDPKTLYRWIKDFAAFRQSRKAGRDADRNVEASLYQRAIGYSHPDVHISNYKGQITVTPITKHYPPDPASMIFWLKNRNRAKWRDKIEHDVAGDINVTIQRFTDGKEDPATE